MGWGKSGDDCQLKIIPRVHIKTDETEFRESLEEQCGDAEISHEEYKNVEVVLEHPLFQRFARELESREDIENKEAVETKVIEAMSSFNC